MFTLMLGTREIGQVPSFVPAPTIGCVIEPGRITLQSTALTEHGLTYAERELARGGLKISAIKAIRERLLCGLKDAKDMVDAYAASPEFTPSYYAQETERLKTENTRLYHELRVLAESNRRQREELNERDARDRRGDDDD